MAGGLASSLSRCNRLYSDLQAICNKSDGNNQRKDQRGQMKPLLLLFMGFALAGGAAVYTDASDANHVTFLNSSGESIEQLTQKANAYCAQYGKTASFKKEDSSLVAIFNCNAV